MGYLGYVWSGKVGNKLSKLGLVVEGGGMKCAYSAAVLDRFLDDGITFDYAIGVSAGSGNIASFLAGQRERNLRFYTEYIHDKEYFGIYPLKTTGSIFGLEYIYQQITGSEGKDPLDIETLQANPTEFEVTATDAITGKPHYFSGKMLKKDDCSIIMAGASIPAVCPPVKIEGRNYYDGGVSDSIPVDHALEKGCDRIVVITSKPRDYVKEPQKFHNAYAWKCHRYPKIVEALDHRHEMYMKQKERLYQLEKEGTAFVFAPSKKLRMSTYDMKEKDNRALYDLGLKDYGERRGEWISWLLAGE